MYGFHIASTVLVADPDQSMPPWIFNKILYTHPYSVASLFLFLPPLNLPVPCSAFLYYVGGGGKQKKKDFDIIILVKSRILNTLAGKNWSVKHGSAD